MDKQHEESNLDSRGAQNEFVPPRHWIGPEELDPGYWADPQVKEKRGQEFYEKPVEWLDRIDQSAQGGASRRDFLTVMGASMAMASFACARRPVHKIIPYVVKPEEITPGVPNWYASTCMECSSHCGILVKDREGRPIKLEGNPDHPVNQGKLCSQGQASLLNLYDPDRLKSPVVRSRGDGSRREADWKQVDSEIQAKLKAIASQNGRVKILSPEISGDSTRRLVKEFLSAFAQGEWVEFDPLSLEEIASAQADSYGTAVIPSYEFDRADVIVSLGADFLGTWLSPVEHAKAWSKNRKLSGAQAKDAKLSKLICFESMMSLTGSNADERYPVRPGDELKVALSLAHELVVRQKLSKLAQSPEVVAALKSYEPEKVGAEIGIEGYAGKIKALASELWANRGKSLIVGGGIQTKTQQAVALQIAVNLLNSALENDGSTVDGVWGASAQRSSFARVSQLIAEMQAGRVDALIVYRSNPVYTLPAVALGLQEAMKKVPLVISISDREDETALLSDYVLPDHHSLENWGDANPKPGVYSIQQPAIAPIHSTRAFQESLLTWAKTLALKTPGLALRAADWHDYLQNHWKETIYKEAQALGSFQQFWESVLRAGVYKHPSVKVGRKSTPRVFRASSLAKLPSFVTQNSGVVSLVLYSKVSLGDGRSANNAWLQELPDPISTVTWDNYLNLGPALAQKLGLKKDDVVRVQVGSTSAELPVYVQPGLHPEVAAVAVGYGRKAAGKVGNGAGVDVYPFVQVQGNQLVFSGQPVIIQKTGKFYSLAATQWHGATENRPIINDITLAQFKKDPAASNHTDPHLRLDPVPSMWKPHEYPTYRWGMAIDLNSCTGCGACMVACQAENNIPVVGRDQVRVSRQMHWIRIDRYYSGSPENPDVVFQPMLCQHCENASCETVCPVLATVHDEEGLNVQVYNRCVGTRYCQNNCPYKVRRFNFFDHWKTYQGTMNMVWNPDVTVRTRGIMEKCTFCTQRIQEAKDHAKDAGEMVKDGQLKTACQQTCPTDAIVFGDLNDPKSKVSQMKTSPQAFRVLEVLNTKPSVSYLTKVRNKESAPHSGHGAGAEHA